MQMSEEEITEKVVQMTQEYAGHYFGHSGKKRLDKELFGALHIGFLAALKAVGYDEEMIFRATQKATDKLIELGY